MCITQTVLALVALYVGSVHSWDLAVANGDLLEFYINQTKIDTVIFKSQNLGALAYDEVHNMILYVSKKSDNDTICGFNMSTMQYTYLTETNGRNIRGLAFDPATELLFFTDTKERSINSISLKSGSTNSVYETILIKMDDGIPTDIAVDSCRGCDAGYSGERCQVNACHGYCQNGGDCSLNGINEPVCECKGDFVGARCQVSDCLNYCIHGNCSINDEGLPKCSCGVGYSGDRCEVSACQGYCLNDGECSLNEEDEPICQCVSSYEGSRCEVVKTDNFPSTRTSYSAESDLTLADLFSKWRKPISKMTVILESS